MFLCPFVICFLFVSTIFGFRLWLQKQPHTRQLLVIGMNKGLVSFEHYRGRFTHNYYTSARVRNLDDGQNEFSLQSRIDNLEPDFGLIGRRSCTCFHRLFLSFEVLPDSGTLILISVPVPRPVLMSILPPRRLARSHIVGNPNP